MKNDYYAPISVDCIDPLTFPDVALHMKSGGNYVLYKPHDRKFTEADRIRLENNKTDLLYIRSGDMEDVADYQENSLSSLLDRSDLGSFAKGKLLFQTAVNYVNTIFETQDEVCNVGRSHNLIRQLSRYVSSSKDALAAFKPIITQNDYTQVHCVQVSAMILLMHKEIFPMHREDLFDVGLGAMLMDLGMSFHYGTIANKPESLSDLEFQKVKQHADKGYEFLKDTDLFSDSSLAVVRHHHERYDGNGYPSRLKGDVIPRCAQLAALCDVFCAQTTDRVYRKAVSPAKALESMQESAGSFNTELYRQFAGIIAARTIWD